MIEKKKCFHIYQHHKFITQSLPDQNLHNHQYHNISIINNKVNKKEKNKMTITLIKY